MNITKYIKEIKDAEIEELDRGIPTTQVLEILKKMASEFGLVIDDTSSRPRNSGSPMNHTVAVNLDEFLEDINEPFFNDGTEVGELYRTVENCFSLSTEDRISALNYIFVHYRRSDMPVGGAFAWSETPQGYDFWNRIERAIMSQLRMDCGDLVRSIAGSALDGAIRRRALEYLYASDERRMTNDSLGDAFSWRNTPQGYEFWETIHRAIGGRPI